MSRILLCGLNGAGKSTLGKSLAVTLGYQWLDIEHYYFPQNASYNPYAVPRQQEEVAALLLNDLKKYPNVILSAVRINYSPEILTMLDMAFYLYVPKDVRMERIRNRSIERFGSRVLPGGDLHEQEEAFFRMVQSREDTHVTLWLNALTIPVFTIDGTKSMDALVQESCHIIQISNAGA